MAKITFVDLGLLAEQVQQGGEPDGESIPGWETEGSPDFGEPTFPMDHVPHTNS